jgi:putative peptidoglycan lipid II flippase
MLGGVLQLALQIPALRALGLMPRIGASFKALRGLERPDHAQGDEAHAARLLGVSVAQISLLINTQIASHLAAGSVSWVTNADRLMEFPTAMLGVALGVVLMPQLAGARAAKDDARYSGMLDWGLRLVVLLSARARWRCCSSRSRWWPCCSTTAPSRTTTSAHRAGAAGYGVGLLGIVAIKVLAPGYYASQDMRTPMLIAVGVLVFTQVLNFAWCRCCSTRRSRCPSGHRRAGQRGRGCWSA